MLIFLKNIIKGLNVIEEAFLCLLLLSMIVLACTQILLRDLFSSGFMWADPLLRHMVLWAGLFGAAIATRKGKHIAIDVVSHLVSPKIQLWFGIVGAFFAALVCAGLTYASIIFVKNEIAYGGGNELLGIASWWFSLVFPIAFSIISLRFLIAAISGVAGTRGQGPEAGG